MEFQNGENSTNLLKAQSHIWYHMFNFINSMSLKCVVDLGIPDIIHNYGKPMPLSKLITSLPIHQAKTGFIYRLMRIATHSGFFSQQNVTEDELEIEYTLTEASKLLLKNHPMSVTPFLLSQLDPILTNPWQYFSTWLKNDDATTFETAHGILVWDYTSNDTKFNKIFSDGMESDTQLLTSVVIEKCKEMFNGLDSLVDVGGCTGTMAKGLAKSFPQMECTVLDLPHVVAGLEGTENLKFVGGDMFKSIPPADAILMKSILHDWGDEECVKILQKCKEAITKKGKKGKVVIIEMVIDSEKGSHETIETQLCFDMMMMVLATGNERNKKEWIKLISYFGHKVCH